MSYLRCDGVADFSVDGENYFSSGDGIVWCTGGWVQVTQEQLAAELQPFLSFESGEGQNALDILTTRQFTNTEMLTISGLIALCFASAWAYRILGKQLFPKG